MDLPEVTTPADLAKRCGWSERRVRDLARQLGACRILGHRMVLTKEDVEAILEATRPAPLPRMVRPPSGWDGIPDKTMKMLLGLSPREKKPPQRRVRLPRAKKPEPPGG